MGPAAGKVLSTKMLARGAFELASTSRYGAASVLVRARDVLTRHVHSSGAAFELKRNKMFSLAVMVGGVVLTAAFWLYLGMK